MCRVGLTCADIEPDLFGRWQLEGFRSQGLPAPRGAADHAAEIALMEVRILVREHVGIDVAEGRLRLVLVAVVKGLDDVFLETRSTRMCMHHRLALRVAVLGIAYPEHIHFDARRH